MQAAIVEDSDSHCLKPIKNVACCGLLPNGICRFAYIKCQHIELASAKS
jgi:hypothetical protein